MRKKKRSIARSLGVSLRVTVEAERSGGTAELSHHREHVARVRAGEDDSVEGHKRAERSGRSDAGGDTVRRGGARL